MIVTQSIINQGATKGGTWSLKQLKCLLPAYEFINGGFPPKGWKIRIISQEVPKDRINAFLGLKNKHLKHNGQLKLF